MSEYRTIETSKFYVYTYLRDIAHERVAMVGKPGISELLAYLDGMLMAAMTMEAYFNHLGSNLFDCWDDFSCLRPEGKLRLILDKIDYSPDFGIRPYQTLTDMIWYRNRIAHGRTEGYDELVTIRSRALLKPDEMKFPRLEAMITLKNLQRFVEDMDAVITDLWEHSRIEDSRLSPENSASYYSYRADIIDS